MTDISLDGRTLAGVENAASGDVGRDTRFEFEQDGDRIRARYAGGDVAEGHLLGTFDGDRWDVRYVQVDAAGETATGHSVGVVTELPDGRVRVEDDWEWESKPGTGSSVLEEVES
ncbi:hypothetical protein [Halogeometricum limi]|uniref:Uncharacterized protein n=1 Tax=Halogeometricum limi TaxID=555875 RepID=A0A1I6I193_9EURY|nr:hypothetical protein [Halogeometricum limi]SFR60465.1 hypothetical protein SAMN04488124_2691 [Halogeometricum limi]